MIAIAKPQTIPQSLIYEVHNGQPIYYRGYKDVLKGIKTNEQIMGSSILQSLLVSILHVQLSNRLRGTYFVLTNELGLQIGKGEERAADIALFPKAVLRDRWNSNKYINLPPEILIEVDTKADLSDFENPQTYYHEKNAELLKWGVKRVIWIITGSRKVMVADAGKKWQIQDWSQPVKITGRMSVNIEKLLEEATR